MAEIRLKQIAYDSLLRAEQVGVRVLPCRFLPVGVRGHAVDVAPVSRIRLLESDRVSE